MARAASDKKLKALKARLKEGPRSRSRIYAGKGVLRKGVKKAQQEKVIKRSVIRTRAGRLLSGRDGKPIKRARVVRALRPNTTMSIYRSSLGPYDFKEPLASVRTGECIDKMRRMRVSKKGALTCQKAPRRDPAKRGKRPDAKLSPYQKSTRATIVGLRGSTAPFTERMSLAAKVWNAQKGGLSHAAAFNQVIPAAYRQAPAARRGRRGSSASSATPVRRSARVAARG